jgi:hypothetical protein
MALSLSLGASSITFTSPSVDDYTAGYVSTAGPTATIKANTVWQLQLSVGSNTWTPSGPIARANKPATDLQWSASMDGSYTSLSPMFPATVATGAATSAVTAPLYFRTRLDWTQDTPGAYALVVTYTLAAP